VFGVVLADPVGPAFGFEDLYSVPGRGLAGLVPAGLPFPGGAGVREADVDGVVQVELLAVPRRDDRLRGDAGIVAVRDGAAGGAGKAGLGGMAVPSDR
jgi:hypothetical protein